MTLRTQIYEFGTLDTKSAILLQGILDTRKTSLTAKDGTVMKEPNKVVKAVLDEIDQMYDDLSRHIANQIRIKEAQENAIKGLF